MKVGDDHPFPRRTVVGGEFQLHGFGSHIVVAGRPSDVSDGSSPRRLVIRAFEGGELNLRRAGVHQTPQVGLFPFLRNGLLSALPVRHHCLEPITPLLSGMVENGGNEVLVLSL